LDFERVPSGPGVYLLTSHRSTKLYAGEALNLRARVRAQFDPRLTTAWDQYTNTSEIQVLPTSTVPGGMLAWQSWLVKKYEPRLNLRNLGVGR
jgi:excinuclease UvrABC nuclease subunit